MTDDEINEIFYSNVERHGYRILPFARAIESAVKAECVRYLREEAPRTDGRWEEVFAQLLED